MPATIPHRDPMSATGFLPPRTQKARQLYLARAKVLGWSQNELARRLGRDIGHVSRIFSGERLSRLFWREAEELLSAAEKARRPSAES